MKFIRKSYWYTSAYVKKHGFVILGAVFGGIFLFSIMFRLISTLPQIKKTTYIGRVGNITLANLPRDIQEKISDGLTSVDGTGNVTPNLAERWTVEDDGKTYRFIINQQKSWQDGKHIEPKDLQYNFTDTHVVASQNELVFKLKEPFAPFPTVVSQPVFREKTHRRFFIFNSREIIGTSAFHVDKTIQDGATVRELQLQSPNERLIYRFYPTERRAILAFKRGEVHVLENMVGYEDLQGWKNTKVSPILRKDQYLAVFFNLGNPLFDKNVRQALNYAIPKIRGEERAETPIDPRSWAYNKTVKAYEFDQSKIVSLLLRSVPKQKITIELSTLSQFQSQAEEIKKQWETLGAVAATACKTSKDVDNKTDCQNLAMMVNLKITNAPDITNFQALLIAQQIPQDPDQYFIWHSTQHTNFTQYKNPHVDKLLEDGRKTVDKKERRSIYQDFQQFLIEDTPAIFLKHLTLYTIEKERK